MLAQRVDGYLCNVGFSMSNRKPSATTHPAERFIAPANILRGVPLARLIGRRAVVLLAESIAAVAPEFDSGRFVRSAMRGLGRLGLMDRAAHVAEALADQLPADFDAAVKLLVASFGPELRNTEGNGLAPFFYLPHSQFISLYGRDGFDRGMGACYELTKRFTAEFCVRPFLARRQTDALTYLKRWSADPNPHVRRLVSEGARPPLPWGIRLDAFQDDPRPTLELLEVLKDDPVPYVHRSVANHLADILKDNPAIAYATCQRWIDEAASTAGDRQQMAPRLWVVQHALRLPAKKSHTRAVRLRQAAKRAAQAIADRGRS